MNPDHITHNHPDHFEWQAPERIVKVKGQEWFWAVGIIALAGAVASTILGNFLFGIVIVLSALTLFMYAHRKPAVVRTVVGEEGVIFGEKTFRYQELDSFWIAEYKHGQKLLIKTKKLFTPLLATFIPEGIDTPNLRALLLDFLPEEEQSEPIAQHLFERLGF